MHKEFHLPYKIVIKTWGDFSCIESELAKEVGKKHADALESLLLSMACKGIDLSDSKFSEALEHSVESIANNL